MFVSTSFLRGVTFDKSIVIFEEYQNCMDIEISTVMTRIGENCKVYICGDHKGQDDLVTKKYEKSGGIDLIRTVERMKSFSTVKFNIEDIVRSGVVKEYLVARDSRLPGALLTKRPLDLRPILDCLRLAGHDLHGELGVAGIA